MWLLIGAASDQRLAAAWWAAHMARFQKLPPLEKFLNPGKASGREVSAEQVQQHRADLAARQSPQEREALLRMVKGR